MRHSVAITYSAKKESCSCCIEYHHCHHHQQIVGAAIPEDVRVREKEDEKEEKYQDLAREVGKMWRVRTKVFPVVVGVPVTIPEIERQPENH